MKMSLMGFRRNELYASLTEGDPPNHRLLNELYDFIAYDSSLIPSCS